MRVDLTAPRGGDVRMAIRRMVLVAESADEERDLANLLECFGTAEMGAMLEKVEQVRAETGEGEE